MEEHQKLQDQLLETMAAAGATEEDLAAEMNNNDSVDTAFDEGMHRVQIAIIQTSLYMKNCRMMGDAEAWLSHSNPASITHVAEGKQQVDKLNLLVPETAFLGIVSLS